VMRRWPVMSASDVARRFLNQHVDQSIPSLDARIGATYKLECSEAGAWPRDYFFCRLSSAAVSRHADRADRSSPPIRLA
jgi:hypothetical protein